ncbi:hypothetical protein BGX28_007965 [Mortierella sp. GBA30]|nr:hypothetical protein BGX28_007965 [Mortierella sp. GBA30]
MGLTFSEDSAQPLQLQIEAQVAGTQKLAYLPTTGPSLDFYYLNYRPSYRAGESHIDFWMFTPQGAQAPKTGSLELLDEFGRIRLAVLVPEGTEIPEALANKHEPFLWKSWKIPKMIKSDFDFSEKFRVVLKTSDSLKATVAAAKLEKNKNQKRFDPDSESTLLDFLLVKGKNKHLEKKNEKSGSTNAKHVVPAAATAATGPLIVQDRQFRIKGLQAVPGGKPNPAKANINSLSATPAANQNNQGVITNKNDGNNDNPTNTAKSTTSSGLSSRTTLSRLVTTALAMFLAASASLW